MKLKNTVIATALLSAAAFNAQAAQELTPEQAAALKPFERITFSGRYDAIHEAVSAASRQADKKGADAFYIQGVSEGNNNAVARVTVDLYHRDAPAVNKNESYRTVLGLQELPKDKAYRLEPFDTVTVKGYFNTQLDVAQAIAKEAHKKDAASFFIVRQVDVNSRGGNQIITAYIYKADAPERQLQRDNAIPADSEAGRAALAAGGAAATQVEIPGVADSDSPSRKVGNFFETQTARGGRYTVTLSDGTQIQELNKATAAKMVPFDSITFRGNFSSIPDISRAVAKRAAERGAKYYQITQQWENKGTNMTISANLYK
ncbi:DUF1471 domain-containing protein [Affinibrenneria salicis]|uniref:DUF1471 domain-containing protein n=1 Tax=Affinibrenneria salicis TaxID=2590031 RepID=A0A5J5G4C1_9GAMM|nr:DUF1471 family protein YdgH [Affinibrenneria salicis]KAA9001901.1 DUF1471 domain-containing protein [Affinibrenneria salicis]